MSFKALDGVALGLDAFLAEEVLDPGDVVLAVVEVAGGEDFALQRDGGLDAFDNEFTEGAAHAPDGDVAGGSGDDQLGDHGVIVGRDFIARVHVGIDAYATATGGVPQVDLARAGGEVAGRVLGVDAALNGVAAGDGVDDVLAQRQAGGDADLLFDEVAAIDFFGDGVLHLDAGIHLHEVEVFAFVIDEVLDSAAVFVADLFADLYSGLAHAFAQAFGEFGAGAFFDDLLVAALHGAVALS